MTYSKKKKKSVQSVHFLSIWQHVFSFSFLMQLELTMLNFPLTHVETRSYDANFPILIVTNTQSGTMPSVRREHEYYSRDNKFSLTVFQIQQLGHQPSPSNYDALPAC